MQRFTVSFLAILLFTFISYGQPRKVAGSQASHPILTIAKPEEAGMSAERLARIDRIVQEYVDKQWLPGAVVLIARHGKIVYYKGLGKGDLDKPDAMRKDDIFRIASQTKAITTTAVMMLYEEGRFQLDDPISRYLPEFKSPKVLDQFNEKDSSYTTVPAKGEITIRQLITHTSGIGYGLFDPKRLGIIYGKANMHDPIASEDFTLQDQMKILAGLPLVHQPGEKWTYGLSIDVLGYLVEVVSGMSLKDFLHQRIFGPLGMKDTYFYLPREKGNRLTALHRENKEGKVEKYPAKQPGIPPDFPMMPNGKYYSGGAGLSSTAMDYAIFLQMMLNKGEYNGKRLLGRKTVEMMTMNQIGDLSLDDNKFGLGFSITTDKSVAKTPLSAGTYAWGGLFGTAYWADPKEDLLAICLTQVYPTNHVGRMQDTFQSLVYQAITE